MFQVATGKMNKQIAGETIYALERRMLGAGEDGCERVPTALGIFLQQSPKDAFGVLPQHLVVESTIRRLV
jgi:hypothetical protein